MRTDDLPHIPHPTTDEQADRPRQLDPPLSPLVTALAFLILLAYVLFVVWMQASTSPLDRVPEPERALQLVSERTLDLREALSRLPWWERVLYEGMSGSDVKELEEARDWYR